ncbi:hypothetical protein [Piscinibacter sakaiensis]|uniref:Ubiquinone biosynthesis protein UbiJ n=1 Tax=Piscinibacter sakaiensis TaxID=1547922 RepID=A0A0K8NZH6_PISS1|nr:hypothetical protein [Piscinibacter sakaiensis]GAP35330.1 hypothetical protein ISF6_0921 [Piscinibacter sakaiensis]
MLESLRALAAPAVLQRLTLLINHVLASETAATHRLRGHAGRRLAVRLGDWPELLPDPPPLVFAITPAGLLDWLGAEPDAVTAPADLQVRIDARNPALALLQGLGGQRPRIEVSGDAALAADVSWLFENLRWDLEDDLARVVGDVPAREIARVAGWIGAALREAATRLARWTGGSDPAGPPPR